MRAKRSRHSVQTRRQGSGVGLGRVLSWLGTLITVGALLLGGQFLLDRPVRNLHLQGGFERVTPVEVQAAMASGLRSSFLSVDLAELQARVEALDWVKSAQIGRQWPDALVVRVNEHQAAARWGDSALLNREGKIFSGDSRHLFPELPRLAGPPDTEGQVARRYLELQRPLGAANLALAALSIDERGSWSLQLQGGQTVRIGRRDVDQRLDRFFVLAAPLLRKEFDRVSHVDMRYTNGFSVGWRPESRSGSASAAGGE